MVFLSNDKKYKQPPQPCQSRLWVEKKNRLRPLASTKIGEPELSDGDHTIDVRSGKLRELFWLISVPYLVAAVSPDCLSGCLVPVT